MVQLQSASKYEQLDASEFESVDVASIYSQLGVDYEQYIYDDTGRLECLDWVIEQLLDSYAVRASDVASDHAGLYVVDLGCASGRPTVEHLASSLHARRAASFEEDQIVGVDISPGMIALAQAHLSHKGARFECADIRTWQPAPRSRSQSVCNAVVSFYSLNHLPREDYEGMIRKVSGWLNPGGVFALGTVAGVCGRVKWMGFDICGTSLTAAENRRLLEENGFEVVSQFERLWRSSSNSSALPKTNQFILARKREDGKMQDQA